MKKTILLVGLLASVSSFAQVNGNAMSICESIRQATAYPDRVTSCIQITSRNNYDQNVIPLIRALVSTSTSEALNALNASANAIYDSGAIRVCEAVRSLTAYPERVTTCLRITANNTYDPSVAALAEQLTRTSTQQANEVMGFVMNSYFQPSAVAACEAVRSLTAYPERVTLCLKTIQNKVFMNGAENYCKNIASSSTQETINCLAKSAMNYVPAPIPAPIPQDDIVVMASELRALKRDLVKARSQLSRGMVDAASLSLQDAIRTVETLEIRR